METAPMNDFDQSLVSAVVTYILGISAILNSNSRLKIGSFAPLRGDVMFVLNADPPIDTVQHFSTG